MLNKRGQLSFIIGIGLFILVVFILIAFMQSSEDTEGIEKEERKNLIVNDQNVRNYVEDCVSKTSKEALFYLGFVGGALKTEPFPFYYKISDNYKIPYFYADGVSIIPVPYNENYWENFLALYMITSFEDCIDNFEAFQGSSIEHGKPVSFVELTDSEVIFTVKYPVFIKRETQTNNIDPDYISSVPSRLKDILQISSTIVDQEVANDLYIHWDYLKSVTDTGLEITAYTENDATIIYKIVDNKNKLFDEPYIFQFANKITLA